MSEPLGNGSTAPEPEGSVPPASEPVVPVPPAPEQQSPVPPEPGPGAPVPAAPEPDEMPPEPEEETGPVRGWLLGIAAFFMILVVSVVVAGAVSLQGLIRQEEVVRSAWGEVAREVDTRVGLLEEAFTSLGWMRDQPPLMRRYRRALAVADTADGLDQEVEAVRTLDEAVSDLMPSLRPAGAAVRDARGGLQTLLERIESTERRRVVAGENYDREVHTYTLRLQRLPTRWVARLFGFSALPYYALDREDSRPAVPDY